MNLTLNLHRKRLIEPPCSVNLSYASADDPFWKRMVIEAVEFATGRRTIERIYNDIQRRNLAPVTIWKEALTGLSVTPQFDMAQLAKVPERGPVVFISNHPFGVVDGLILGYLVASVRPQFVMLVNDILCQYERLSQFLLPIDFRETKQAARRNIETKNKALSRMRAGEALAIFPAGGVATSPGFRGKAEDLEWKRFVGKVIQTTRATVVPIYVHGQNSRLFQVVSQFSMTLRLALLLYEVKNKMGNPVRVTIGDPIDYQTLAVRKNRHDLMSYLREVTYGLADNS